VTTREFFVSIAGMGPVDVLALSLRVTNEATTVHGCVPSRIASVARSGDVSSSAGGGSVDLRGECGVPPPVNYLEAVCDARR
jgi:hypothetical protein